MRVSRYLVITSVAGLLAGVGLSISPASAVPIVPIHITASGLDLQSDPFSFDAWFDATFTGSGYDLISVSGSENAYVAGLSYSGTITGLTGYADADNTLDLSLQPDFGGFSFATDIVGDLNTNVFTTCDIGPCAIKSSDDPVGYSSSGFELTKYSATIPEPLTLSLVGAGLMGLGVMRRRKSRSIQKALTT